MADTRHRTFSFKMRALASLEFLICFGSLYLAYYIERRWGWVAQLDIQQNILIIYALLFALTAQLFALSLGLYNAKFRDTFRAILRRIAIAIAMGAFVMSMLTTVAVGPGLAAQVTVMATVFAASTISLIRYIEFSIDYLGYTRSSVLVLGAGERASIIEQRMKRRVDRQHFNLHGFVIMRGDSDSGIQKERKFTLEGESLAYYLRDNEIDEIVVACDERRHNLPLDILLDCKIHGTEVIDILDFIERETGQVAVNLIYPSWVIYSAGFASTNYLRDTLDWTFNASLAAIVLFFTWPLMLLTYLAIKLEDGVRASTVFVQERVGVGGHVFNMVKFRSMSQDAERDGPRWATKNDERVTRVGRIIRKFRLDELPQLYNVVLGDMGFVGPRPERPEFVRQLVQTIPYYNQRHNVKPGLTGWAQLKYPYGASEEDALEKLKFDLYYVKHRSFLLDLHILIQTVEVVLFGKGQ